MSDSFFGDPSSSSLSIGDSLPDTPTPTSQTFFTGGAVGAANPTSTVFTSPSPTASDSVFSGLNTQLSGFGNTVSQGVDIFNKLSGVGKKANASPTTVALATPAVVAPVSSSWIHGVPNSVVVVGAIGLGVVLLLVVMK